MNNYEKIKNYCLENEIEINEKWEGYFTISIRKTKELSVRKSKRTVVYFIEHNQEIPYFYRISTEMCLEYLHQMF